MDYHQYLQSSEWEAVRTKALRHWGYRCAICNSTGTLEVHHRTYEHLGQERPTDVIVLCDKCHGKFHDRLPSWYGWLGRISSKIFESDR